MEQRFLNTEELAKRFLVKGPSIRSEYCRKGHYHGLRPVKLPNGKLAWPAEDVDRVLATCRG